MSSMEVIKRIKEAEEQAEGIRQEAIQKGRDIMINAQEEADRLANELIKKTIERGNNLMAETEAEATREIESLKQKNDIKISELRARAQENLNEAVSFVLGRIVKDYGRN
jgi:V/A-type H+-transporting ATPase subunit G/H